MQILKNMTIGRRIFFGLGVVILILVGQGVFSIWALNAVSNRITTIEDDKLPSAIVLGRINTNVADLSGDQLRLNQATDPKEQTELEATMEEIRAAIEKDETVYESLASTAQETQLYGTFKNQLADFLKLHETLTSLAKTRTNQNVQTMLADMDIKFDEISATLNELISLNEQGATVAAQDASDSFTITRKVIYIGVLLALLLGILAGFYMKMGATQISGIVRNSVEQLIKLSLALSASTQQASAGAQQNAAIAQQVAAGATQQSKQAEEISRALTKMSQAISQMAATSQEVSDTTVQASKVAQQTGVSTEKIGKMAEVVTTTAEQTNLLALNAAIEAARAGDAGRGFAVVADEVRKLADSSSKAADEVQHIIKEIATNISITVESIGKSSVKIGDVASGIGNQASAIVQIAKTMDSITSVAQQSAAGAQQLSAATQQTSAATQQVTAASVDLQRLADELQKLVGRRAIKPPKGRHTPATEPGKSMRVAAPDTERSNSKPGTVHRPQVYHALAEEADNRSAVQPVNNSNPSSHHDEPGQ
jgi:methyl-accepting chemotaxis protein